MRAIVSKTCLLVTLAGGIAACGNSSASLSDNEKLVGATEVVPDPPPPPPPAPPGPPTNNPDTGPLGTESLVFTPATYDFGNVSSHAEPVELKLILTNQSARPTYLASVDGPTDLSWKLVGHECPLAPIAFGAGAHCEIVVAFKPVVAGALNWRVTASFGDKPDEQNLTASVSLGGTGVLPLQFDGLKLIDPAGVSTTKVALAWNDIDGVSSYAIYDDAKNEPIEFVTPGTKSYTVQGLLPDTTYVFRVNALNLLGESDGNATKQTVKTDAVGAFAPIPAFAAKEAQAKEGVDLAQFCTDVEGNVPTFMAVANASAAGANCVMLDKPFRLQCTPDYKTGHAPWSVDLTLACILNDYPTALTQTVTVNVADTNRAPAVATIANQSVLAGTPIAQVDANGPTDQDADLDTLTYACSFDLIPDGNVVDGAPGCGTLVNLDGSPVAFDPASGVLNWVPPLTEAGKTFELRVDASDGTLSGTRTFTVNVGQPPPSPNQSTVTVSGGTVASGASVTITLQAKDLGGNTIHGGGATVTFSSAGGTATGTIGPTVDHGDGTYTATFTGVKAGSATTITAYIAGAAVTTSSPTVAVTPGAVSTATSTLSVSANTVPSGSSVTLTLTAKDAAGNLKGAGGSAVVFSRSGGTSTGTVSATTDNGDGTYTATFTGAIAGTPTTVGATIAGNTVTTTAPTVKVNPGPPSLATSVVTVSGAPTSLASGASATFTLRAKDAAGNTITSGGLSVTFALSGGSSTGNISSVVDNGDGTYTAVFTAGGAGTAVDVVGTVGGSPVTTTAPSFSVVPGPVSLANSVVSVGSASLASGSSTTLTLLTKDAYGNNLTAGGLTVVFTRSGGTSTGTIGAATDLGNGSYTATFTGVAAGSATSVRATIGGALISSVAPQITVVPGPVSNATSLVTVSSGTVASGATVNLALALRDANNNAVPLAGQTVVFNRSGGVSTGTIGATTDNGNGTYGATFTGQTAGTATTIGATINGTAVTGTLPTVTVVPGPVSVATSVITVTSGTIASGATTTLRLVAKDASGNDLATGGHAVAFGTLGGSSTGTISAVTDNADGSYTAIFTGVLAGTATAITATINGAAVTTASPTVTVTPGAASPATSLVTVSAGTAASGAAVTLQVTAKDAAGNLLTTGGSTVVFNLSGGTSNGTIGATSDNGDGTYTATFTAVTAGSAASVGASLNGTPITTPKPTLQVNPGAISAATSTVTTSAGSVFSGGNVTLTLRARDANGNLIAVGGESVAFTYSGGSSTGVIGTVNDGNNGFYTASFTGVIAGSATTIAATINGTSVTTSMPTIAVTPGSISLSQSVLSASAASVASGSAITLTLQAKDANGNGLTSGGSTVVFGYAGGTSTGAVSATTDNGNGTYTATFTGTVAGTATSLRATVNGSLVTSAQPSVTVIAGPVAASRSLVTVSAATVASGGAVNANLRLKDANDNDISTGGATVVFNRSGGTSNGTFGLVSDNGDGTYTAAFNAVASGTATTIGATINGVPVSTTLPTVTVVPGGSSLATSVLSVGSPVIASGGVSTVTLVVKDANGNQLTAGGLTVVFSHSGGTSTGTFSAVTDNSDGTYSATFTGVVSGTATTIRASINAANVTSTLPTVTVNPGTYSLAQSQISVGAASVASGSSVTLTLQLRDAAGNLITTGGPTVAFARAGGTSTGAIGAVTDHGDGHYTAAFTGQTAGTATSITATINGSPVTSGNPSLQVLVGALSLAQSTVSVSAGTIAAGGASSLTLQAKDAFGNNLTTGGETVLFNRSGGTANGTFGGVSDNGNGTYTTTFTGTVAGSATTIGATVNGAAVTSTLPTITVNTGAIATATSLVSVSGASVASGATRTLTLQAKDAYGNNLGAGGATVVFFYSGGTSTGTVSATTDSGNGTYSATFTGLVSGAATTIGANINGTPVSTALPTITVTPGGVSVATSTLNASAATVASGSNVTLTLQAKDANGNNLTTGGAAVVLSSSGGTSTGTLSGVTDNGNGTYTATFTGVAAGSATTIAATVGGSSLTSTLPTVAVLPGPVSTATSTIAVSAASVASGGNVTVTVRAKDANGNDLTAGGRTVAVSTAGGTSTGALSGVTDNGNGTYTAAFTANGAGTATTVSATIDGVAIITTQPTITVVPGAVSLAQSTVSVSAASVASGSGVTLTLQAKDANGNNLTAGGAAVVFSRTGGTSTGAIGSVTDNGNGSYSAIFTGIAAGSATTINATYDGAPVTSALPTVTVTPGAPSLSASTITVSAGSVASGGSVTLTLAVKDANGNGVGAGGATVVFSRSGGTSTGAVSGTTDNNDGTYTATFTGAAAGTATSIRATLGGSNVTSASPTVTVVPGALSLAQSVISVSAASVASGSSVTLTLRTKDANGNDLTAGGETVVFSRSGGSSTGSVGATTDNGDGTYSATFTAAAAGTATTINATVDGAPVTSTLPTVTVVPGANSLATSTVSVSAGSVQAGGVVTLTLQARDASGNPHTSGGLTVVFSATGGTSAGTISATTDHGDGHYTATFTGQTSGSATTVGASINGSAVVSTLPTVTVTPAALSLSVTAVTLSGANVASGSNVTLTLQAKDAYGNNLTAGGATVVFTRAGGTSTGTISATTDNGNGTYTATFTGQAAGTATSVSATVNGSALTSSAASLTVNVGPLSLAQSTVTVSQATIASGATSTLTLQAKDAYGNDFTTGGLTVVFNRSGGTSTSNISATTDNGNGTYTAVFTGIGAGTAASIGATVGGSAVTSAAPTVTVTPGALSLSQSRVTVSAGSVASGGNVTLTLQAKDANGNNLTAGGATVVFNRSGGTSTGTIGVTTDNGNGTYTASFSGLAAGTATTISATVGGAPVTSTLPTVTVVPDVVSVATSTVSVPGATLTSGASMTVTLQAKDANGNNLTTGGATVVFSRSGGASTGSFSGTIDNGNGTYTATFTGLVAGTATTIGATINGAAVTSTLPTVSVLPAAVAPGVSTVTVSAATVASGGTVTLTVAVKDANANLRTAGGDTVAFTVGGGTSAGTVGSVTDNNDGTYTATFTAVTAGTAATVGATINGAPITSTLPTITVTPGTLSLAQSRVTVSAASLASGATATLTLQAKDANGNNLTAGGATVVFTRSGGSSTGTISGTTDNGDGTYTAIFSGLASGTATTIGATVDGSAVTSTLPTITVVPGALSLAVSTVSVSSATLVSGTNVTLTFTAKDANANLIGAGGASVAFSATGGTSTGTIGAVTDNANGTYTATFTGLVAGTATTIDATVGGSAVTSAAPTLTVTPGAVSVAQSAVTVSAATVASGANVTLTLRAKDANGNNLPAGGATVAFTRSGGTSNGTIGTVSDNGDGTYTATFTATVSGSATTIGATINGATVTSGLPTVTVTPGSNSLATSTVTASAGSVASGSAVTLTLTAKDSNGNQMTGGGLLVTFTASGGTATGTISSVTDNGNGTYSATFTAQAAGTATTIGATIGGAAVTSTLPTVAVTPSALSLAQSVVSLSGGTVASGSAVTLTLQAKDAYGNNLTAGGATVVFTRTGGTSTGTISATTDNGNGTYSATFTGQAAGTATSLSATVNGSALTSAAQSLTVSVGPLSLAQSTVAVGAGSIASGTSTTLTLRAKDAYGNDFTTGGLTVVFNRSGGTATGNISGTTDNNDGTYSATFAGVVAGSATTIGATIGGSAVTSTLPTVAVTVGSLSLAASTLSVSSGSVASGSAVTLTLQAKDVNGNNLTTGGATVVFSATGGTSTGTVSGTTDHNDGTYTATFTGTLAGTAKTVGATVGGSAVTSSAPTVTVVPGAISTAGSVVSVSAGTVASGGAITLTLQAKDANGNNLTAGGSTVAFNRLGGTATGAISATTDNNNGTYTATFTAVGAGTATTITATIGGAAVTSTLPTVTVTPGAVAVAQSTVSLSSGTVASGGTVTVTLQAKDANGNNLTAGGLTVAFTTSGGVSGGTFSAVSDNSNGTYTATFTAVTAGSATTVGATIGGSAVSSTLPTLTVNPGALSLAQSQVTVSLATVASGDAVLLTLRAKDANGNNLTAGGATVAFTRSGGTSNGAIGSTTDNLDGTYTASFTAVTAGSATTIGATVGGAAVTSALPTITVTPGAVSLAQSTVSASAGTVASGAAITLTLQARDANGNNLATGGLTVAFVASGGTSTGTIGAVTDNSNGTYTASFTGQTAGTVTQVGATIGGSNVTSAKPSVTVVPGALSLAQSTVAVSGAPTTLASGASVGITLTARDSNGNQLTAGGATVVFGVSGGTSTGSFSAVADNANGTYTATFTAQASGTAISIGATVGGAALTSALPSFSVVPGAVSVAQSTITVGSASVTSGFTTTLSLTTRDAYGNLIPAGGKTVVFGRAGGTSNGSISATTDNSNGTYAATFTAVVSGTATTINATIDGVAVTSTLPTVTVLVGAVSLARSTVAVSAGTVLSGGSVSVTLTAKDANDNDIPTGGATVVFNRSGGASTGNFSAVTDNGNGTYSATFTGVASGTATTIGATYNGSAITNTLPTVTVNPGPYALAVSTVTSSAATVVSGNAVTLTVRAKDAAGNNLTTGGLTVVFSRSGGTATGTISATSDNGDGTYTATFTGVGAGTATTIGATINGAAVTSTLPTVAVTVGPLDLAHSVLSTSGGTVASGSAVTLTLTAKDVNDNALTAGGATVVFSNAGGSSTGSISATTDNNNGTYTATFTGVLAGTATTISATVGASLVTSASPTVTVIPGALSLAQSTVTVAGAPAILASGSSATVTVTTRDAAGNQLTAGGRTIVFNKSGGTSTVAFGSVSDNLNGTYTASMTGQAAGTAISIGATINGSAVTSSLPSLTVLPGPVSLGNTTVTVGSGTISSGGSTTLTLTVRDAYGNAYTSGGETVAFTASGGTSTGNISGVTDNNNGTYTATFTGVASGSATTIGATVGGAAVTSSLPTVTVNPGAISTAASLVSVSASSVAAGGNVTLTLTAKDVAGNAITTGGATVVFTRAGGTATGTISATTDNGNGTYTATFTGNASGTATTIGAKIAGVDVTTSLPTITVNPGALSLAQSVVSVSASSLNAGGTVTLTLTAKDAYANNLTTGGATVVFTRSGGASNGTISGTSDGGNGTYTATFTGTTSGTATTIGATVGGSAVTSTLPTLTVNPGAISLTQTAVTVGSGSVASGGTTTLTLTVRDAYGNQHVNGGRTVVFSLSGGTATGTIGGVTDNTNGTYSATFTGVLAGTATSVGATVDGSSLAGAAPTIVVTPGAISASTSTLSLSSGSVNAGSTVTATLQAKDAAGNNLTSGGSTVTWLIAAGPGSATFAATSDNNNGTYTTTVTGTTAGTATIGAQIGGVNVTTTQPVLTVNPGAIATATSTVTLSAGTVTAGGTRTLTLQAKDAYSNNLAAGGATVVFTCNSGPCSGGNGTIGSVTDNNNGTYTATFTSQTSGTAVFGATIGGSAASSTASLTVNPGVISTATSTLTAASSPVTSGTSVDITLQAKDSFGNNLTAGGSTVVISCSSGPCSGGNGTTGATSDLGNGTYRASFTSKLVGTATFSATIGGSAITTSLPAVAVNPGAMDTSTSTLTAASASALSGAVVRVTLQGKDANGNNRTTGGGSITIVCNSGPCSGGNGSLSALTDAGDGTYYADFTSKIIGVAEFSATISASAITTALPTVTVSPGAISAAASTVTLSVSSVIPGNSATATLQAKDANGNNIAVGGATVAFTTSGGTSAFTQTFPLAATDNSNGTYSATITGQSNGTAAAIGATISAIPTTSTASLTVIPPIISTISGEPTGVNNTVTLDVTVAGTNVTFYKFKVGVAGSTDCTDSSGYSADTAVASHITASISGLADGSIKLCVLGRDASNNWQTYASATSATWTKDATAPAFTSLSLVNEAADGYLNAAEHVLTNPLAGSLVASGYDTATYALVPSATTCNGSVTYGVMPVDNSTDFGSDGAYKVCVKLTDTAGNTPAYGATSALNLDTSLPSFTSLALVNTAADGYVNASENASSSVLGASLAASGHDTAAYKLVSSATTCNGALTYGAMPAANSTDFDAGDGQYKICVRLADAAGNPVAYGQSSNFYLDTQSPTYTSLDLINEAQDGYINIADHGLANALAGNLVAGGYDTVSYKLVTSATVCNGGLTYGTMPADNSTDFASDGTYKICVKLFDAAGNPAVYGATASFVLDLTAPSFTSLDLANDAADGYVNLAERSLSNPLAGSLSAAGYDSAQYKLTAGGNACSVVSYGAMPATNSSDFGSDGTYKVCVKLTDTAGNATAYGSTSNLTLDTGVPSFTSIALVNEAADGYVNSAEHALTNSLVGAITGSNYDTATYKLVTSGTTCDGSLTYGAAPADDSADFGSDATYKVCVKLADAAGNPSAYGASGNIAFDSIPPVFTSFPLANAAADDYVNAADRALSSDLAGPLSASGYDTVGYKLVATATACDGNLTYTGVIPPANTNQFLGDGVYKICVKLADLAGNVVYSATSTFTLDATAPPDLAAFSGATCCTTNPKKLNSTELTLTWPADVSDWANVKIYSAPGASAPATCSGTVAKTYTTFTAGATVTFVDQTGEYGAPYSYTACVTDAAGNVTSNLTAANVASSAFQWIFSTNTTTTGSMGGLAGADNTCATFGASIDPSVDWVALLSTDSIDAAAHVPVFGDVYNYVSTTPTLFANGLADMWNHGTMAVTDLPKYNHLGTMLSTTLRVHTGTLALDGVADRTNNCGNWLQTTGNSRYGRLDTTTGYISTGTVACSTAYRFMCVSTQMKPLVSFSATQSATAGQIDLATTLPSDVTGWGRVEIRRRVGGTTPNVTCSDSSDTIVSACEIATPSGGTVNCTDNVGTTGGWYSYRACVYDANDQVVASSSAALVRTKWTTPAHVVLATNTLYSGNIGNVAGADTRCQTAGNVIDSTKTWVAIISNSSTPASGRFTLAAGADVRNLNGDLVTTQATGLWAGSLTNPVRYTEAGQDAATVWTATTTAGAYPGGNAACNTVWSSASTTAEGQFGNAMNSDGTWINNGPTLNNCNVTRSLYCISSTAF